ncbi:MAG: SPFH domain-containing protein [Candidatus Gastranaerophilales bacterium]|nr:SPFH domain-containing protein [Candidatus Gastranaerophilales bacterium]
MGLIKAAKDAIGSMMADQWREYFYCDSMPNDILVTKGKKRVTQGRNSNSKGVDNIITNGSIIAVNEGQCMIIVEQGGIVELCADAGEFVFDASTEPTIFYGDLGQNITDTFKTMVKRFTFGGNTAKDQRIYFFNTKEIMGNLFGTANPIPFRVVDTNISLDVDISVRCNGEYSFKLVDPLLFYKNVCGNVTEDYNRSKMASQMKSELMTALQPAFAKISAMGVRYSAIPAHSMELAKALNEELSELWGRLRGIEIVTLNINSIKASEEDEKMIKDMQRQGALRNPGMAAATLTAAQAEAMKLAAANTSTGPMMAFAGMNMASNVGGMNANQLFQMDAQNQAANVNTAMGNMQAGQGGAQGNVPMRAPVLGWSCQCGQADNKGKFCANCGAPKPAEAGWTCSCGTVNQGKFCVECGAKKPEGAPLYKCDKCGWEPEDPAHPPKFCPECGDIFDENDKI